MNPIDYSLPGIQQTPVQAIASGYALGANIRNDQQQQAALQQQQQIAQQQQAAIQGLISNPRAGAQDYSAASLLFPQLKDQIKQSWEIKNTAQQESNLRDMGQAYSAVVAGRPDVAVSQMQSKADAMEAAGASPQEVQALRTQAQVIQAHPEFARSTMGMMLASVPGGDKVLTGVSTAGKEAREQEQAPAELATKNATAGIKQVEAANAPTATALANENAGEDAETKRFNRNIAVLDTQIKQANSETSRGQLQVERDKLVAARDEKAKAKTDAEQSKFDSIDRSLQTVNAIANHPGLEALGFNGTLKPGLGGVGTVTGKISGLIPGSDRKNLQGLVDTLQSQQFLTSIKDMQGMGALSDAEGKKISSAVATLDLDQSAGAFKNALGVVRTTLEKARNKSTASGNLPTQGGGFVMKVPGLGNVTEGDINRMMTANPGSTREQALAYLQSKAGAK